MQPNKTNHCYHSNKSDSWVAIKIKITKNQIQLIVNYHNDKNEISSDNFARTDKIRNKNGKNELRMQILLL